jgi:hypothetical protein
MHLATAERRTSPRRPFDRSCKLYDTQTGKYLPARTLNSSDGGLLVEVSRQYPLHEGKRMGVGVEADRQPGLLRRADMLEVVVVRCDESAEGVRLGLKYVGSWIPAQYRGEDVHATPAA